MKKNSIAFGVSMHDGGTSTRRGIAAGSRGAIAASVRAALLASLLSASAQAAQPLPESPSHRKVEPAQRPVANIAFEIPQQSLGDALAEWSRQSGLQVLQRDSANTSELKSDAVNGTYSPVQALEMILRNTGFTYEFVNERTVRVAPMMPSSNVQRYVGASHVASATQDTSRSDLQPRSAAEAGQSEYFEEILVTAQKRVERLQDVPVPVTAIDAKSLVAHNQIRLQDYYTKIPGLSFTLLGDVGAPTLTIRGVSTGGYTTPTVGITVDDVPFGGSHANTGGGVAPDLDPSELARVEVLRGPQGTLYGANSLGGLLKYVTVDPSTDRVSGRLQADLSSVENGAQVGYNLRGAVNLPLGETFAVLASGFKGREAGYIDDPGLGQEGVNRRDVRGGRIAALWTPSEAFSLKLSALIQKRERDGEETVHLLPGLGDLQHTGLIGTGWYENELKAYSAVMRAQIGSAELTSVTGYSSNAIASSLDATPSIGIFAQNGIQGTTFTGFGVPGTQQIIDIDTRRFSQELRLATALSERIDWLVGAFYSHEEYPQDYVRPVVDSAGNTVGIFGTSRFFSEFTEYAAFTNFTFQITDRFDLQVGGRQSQIELEDSPEVSTGPFNLFFPGRSAATFVGARQESRDDAFTYLVTPRLRLSPNTMLYARFASGYRPGGPNDSALAAQFGLPREYSPDLTQNYEIGVKGDFLDRVLSYDASLYYIDWKDIQIQLRDPASNRIFITNAGGARSQGVELSLAWKPIRGMEISAWGAWNDAGMTEVPTSSILRARKGDTLPYSSELSGSLSVDQEFPIWNVATAFVGASASYVDNRTGRFFTNTLPRQKFPAYTQVDARVGARFDTWTINAFVNNLTDERGVLRGGRDSSLNLLYSFTYIQPRSIGLSLSKTF